MPPHQKKIIEKVRSWKDTTTILNLALINVYQGKISQLIGATIHLITKIQILALCFKFSYKFLPVTSTWITKFSNLIADVFIFKDLFSFASESVPVKVAFFAIHSYNIILMAILVLLLSLIVRRKHVHQNLQSLWPLLVYIHCLIFLFPCFNFSISGVIYWARGDIAIFSTASMNYILVPICSILTLSWNMCVIMLSNVFLLTSLQANSPLSMKTNLLQQFEVAEKCLLFLLSEAMPQNEAAPWLILILSLVSTIVKNIYVYLALPYYSMQTLRNDVLMNSSITTISILNVIAKIIIGSKHSFGSSEVILAWLLFSPFAAKFFYNRLQNIYSTLLRAVIDDTSPDHLLHRIPLYRLYLMKKVELNLENDKVDFFNLYITGKNHIMKPYVKDTGEQVTFDLTNRYHFKIYALSLLRDSVKLHNDYWPLKVAYIRLLTEYAFFVQALYFIEQTKKVSLTLNQEAILYILQSEIESILLKKYENQKPQKLNMLRFLEASNTYNSLRTQIMQQINEQQTFWHTYQHRKVNFINLVTFSNKIESRKLELQKFWKQNEMNVEENFISLYLIYGVYLELANYRPTNGYVMINQYTRKSAAIKKIFDRDELSNDTIFAPENTSIEISGVKETLGTILECSHSIRKSFGFHREDMIGLNITTILPDWLKDKHNNALFHFYETGTKTVLNHTRQVLAMTSSGYLFPTHIHVRLNPFLENKISYVGLLKPMKQSLNCLIILPDGTIDGLTKEIASELNIQPNSRTNMLEICPDFQTISDVTNSVAYHQITGKEDFEMLFIDLNEVNKKSLRRKRRFTSYKSNSPQDTSVPVSPSDSEKQLASRSPFSRRSIHENFTRVFQQSTRFLDYESALQHYNRYREEGAEVTLYCFQDPRKGFFKTFKQLRAHVRVENMVVGQDWARVVFINTFIEHKWSHPHNKRSSTIKLAELDSHQSIQTRHDGERTRKNKSRTEPEVGAFSRLRLSTKISIEEEGLGGASPFKLNYFRSSGGVDSEGYPLADETIPLEKKVSRHFNYKVTINSDSNVVTPPSNNLITQTKTQIPKTTQGETKLTYFEETEHKGGDIENPNAKSQAKENESSAKKVQAIRIEQKEIDNFEGPASSFGGFFQQGMKLKIQKALEEALESHNKTRKYTYFTLAFIMCMILIASTVLIQMGMSINAFNDISEKNQIITTANERLDSLIFTNFNLREWYCLIQGRFGNISEPTYSQLMKDKKTILTSEIKRLSTNNNNLREAVDLIDQRVQNNFYDTSVHVYDVALNGTPEGFTLDNTFTTIQKMLSSGFTFVAADSYPPFQPNQGMMFFLYNSYNDLLISNDNSVTLLLSDMENKISGYQSGLSGVTASVAIALVVFLLSSLMIISKIKKSVQSFGAFFFRIDDLDAKVIANNLNSFDKLLKENYQDEALLSNLNVIEESAKERDGQTRGRLGNKNVVYKIYNLQNQLLVLRLWPLVLLVMGLLIGFSVIKLNNVSQIKKLHEQSIASGSNLINMNLAVSLFVEMIGANMTTKIENQPILDQFTLVLENLSQTQALLDYFKDNKGQIESSKSELLSNFSCNAYFEGQSPDFTELCYNISAGAGSTSIVALNNQIWQMAHEGLLSYLNTNQTPEEQTEVLLNGNKTYPSLIKVGRQLNMELWRQVLADFQLFLISQTKQTYQFSIYFEVLTIIILICSFPWALTKMNDKDYELKKMFKLVPLNIILKNRWLKAYLVMNSNKILHPLKNVL